MLRAVAFGRRPFSSATRCFTQKRPCSPLPRAFPNVRLQHCGGKRHARKTARHAGVRHTGGLRPRHGSGLRRSCRPQSDWRSCGHKTSGRCAKKALCRRHGVRPRAAFPSQCAASPDKAFPACRGYGSAKIRRLFSPLRSSPPSPAASAEETLVRQHLFTLPSSGSLRPPPFLLSTFPQLSPSRSEGSGGRRIPEEPPAKTGGSRNISTRYASAHRHQRHD